MKALTAVLQLAKRLNLVSTYGPCWCLHLYRFGRFQGELCYAPADYEPPEHVHPNSDGEFLILYAKNRFIYRKTHLNKFGDKCLGDGDYYVANVPPWRLRTLSVRAGVPHAFKRGDSPMLWICFETWRKGTKVTSVAEDLVLV